MTVMVKLTVMAIMALMAINAVLPFLTWNLEISIFLGGGRADLPSGVLDRDKVLFRKKKLQSIMMFSSRTDDIKKDAKTIP